MSRGVPTAKKVPASTRGRPREFDTNTVLESVGQIFWNQGYHATSIDDLCKATGLLRGSLYAGFGDKHGIMMAALEHYAEGSVARLAERLNASDAPEESLRGALMHVARVSAALSGPRGCFVSNSTLEMPIDDDALRARLGSIQRRMATLLSAAVIRGQASGALKSALDEKAAGQFLLCVMQGMRVLGRLAKDENELVSIIDVAMGALT
jgi:TetR/AcrR family transcriptional regulator, transcriptional repressor for nem operon